MRSYKLSTQLRKMAKVLKQTIDDDEVMVIKLSAYLQIQNAKDKQNKEIDPIIKAYLLITWILEASSASHGFGFPFDRVHFDTYKRLKQAYPTLNDLEPFMKKGLLPLTLLHKIVVDSALESVSLRMTEKIQVFDQLRQCMRIALPERKQGLNDDGDTDIKIIEKEVTQFCQDERIIKLANSNHHYKRLLKQIEKFKDKLFADPIKVKTPAGDILIQPQRTNNIMEQFFRDVKRHCRKKNGLSSLSKTLKGMLADTALIKNLTNADYMKILLKGKTSLEDRFADIDIEQVRLKLREEAEQLKKYPYGMGVIFKMPDLPEKLKIAHKNQEKVAQL